MSAAGGDGTASLLSVAHLKHYFPIKEGLLFDRERACVHAVDDVSFELKEGETLGLVGESGCGKTTLARALMRLIDRTDGSIRFRGREISKAGRRQLRPLRPQMQMVFQDPFASLNPRKTVSQTVAAPLRLHGADSGEAAGRVGELLDRGGRSSEHAKR